MKKTEILGLLALGAVSVLSCTKESESIKESDLHTVTLNATEEGNTKVGFDKDGKFYWTKGDKIAVTTASQRNSFTEFTLDDECSGQATGTFTGITSGTPEGYAIYPAAFAQSISGDNVTISYPATYSVKTPDQTFFVTPQGEGKSFNSPMWGKVVGESITFKHLGGVLCLKIDKLSSVEGVVTVTSDNQLYGDFSVDLSSTEPVCNVGTDGSKYSVKYEFTDAEVGKPGVFYLPLPVGDYKSVKVRVESSDKIVYSETSLGDITIKRKTLLAKSVATSYSANLPTHDGVRVYANNQTEWTTLDLYTYTQTDSSTPGIVYGNVWPGATATGSQTINGVEYSYYEYDMSIIGKEVYLIFNDGGNGNQTPGPDYLVSFADGVKDYFFNVTESDIVEVDPKCPDTRTITIYVKNNTNSEWSNIHLYQYGDVEYLGGYWPGKKFNNTKTIDGVQYSYAKYSFRLFGKNQKLIFNNGTGGVGNQTGDYPFTFDNSTTEYFFSTTKEAITPIK